MRNGCHDLSCVAQNPCTNPSDLSAAHNSVQFQNGIIQGDPMAKAMYGKAILPLIDLM